MRDGTTARRKNYIHFIRMTPQHLLEFGAMTNLSLVRMICTCMGYRALMEDCQRGGLLLIVGTATFWCLLRYANKTLYWRVFFQDEYRGLRYSSGLNQWHHTSGITLLSYRWSVLSDPKDQKRAGNEMSHESYHKLPHR